MTWLLLIYTVPSKPSGKRTAVWRDLKACGATYLRDGVAVLPERAETSSAFHAIANRIATLGGEATIVAGALLAPAQAEALEARMQTERREEYADLAAEATLLLAHVEAERTHRHFVPVELKMLREDLGKLWQWRDRIRGRDYFGAGDESDVDAALDRCARSLAVIGVGASTALDGAPR